MNARLVQAPAGSGYERVARRGQPILPISSDSEQGQVRCC